MHFLKKKMILAANKRLFMQIKMNSEDPPDFVNNCSALRFKASSSSLVLMGRYFTCMIPVLAL